MPDSSVTLQGDYNYQPDSSYTDPLGAVVTSDTSYDPLEIQKMRAALEAKNKPQQMSIGEMASNLYGNLQDYEKKLGITDMKRLLGQIPAVKAVAPVAQVPLSIASGFPAALAYGYVPPGSSPEAYQQAQARSDALQYQPENPYSRQMLEGIGSAFTAAKIPPYIGHLPPARLSPSDVQVMGARGINTARELKAVPQDFVNAQSGLKRTGLTGEPTYGVKLQQMADELGDYAARQQSRGRPTVSLMGAENLMPETKMNIVKGPSAKTWDLDAIKAAEDMESKNLPDPLTHKVTGSWKGPDNKWRQEISDDKATLNQRTFNDLQNFVGKQVHAPLKSFLDHPEFFAAYPEAKNIDVIVGPFGEEFRAAYSHANNAIYINESEVAKGSNDVLKNLIHELTHHVQNVEGFERGANINEFPEDKDIIVAQELENVMSAQKIPLQEAVRRYTLYNGAPPSLDAIEYAERGQGNIIKNPGKEARYHRVFGEAESESMEDRMFLTPEQRREHYPLQQQSFQDLLYERPSYGIKFNPKNALIRKPGSSDFISAEQFKKQGYTHTPLAIDNTELPPDLEMAIKNPGGNWDDARLDLVLRQHLHSTIPTIIRNGGEDWKNIANEFGYSPEQIDRTEKDFALNNWVDKRLKSYIKNDLGTPKDPVRDLADQGITHIQDLGERYERLHPKNQETIYKMREKEGQQREDYGATNAGKDWENRSEYNVDPQSIKSWADYFPVRFANNDGLQKALEKDSNAKIYTTDSGMIRDLGLDHLTDELHAAIQSDSDLPQHLRISTKDLERMTVPDAVRLVSKINKYRADLAEKATVKNLGEFRQNFPALKTYDNGMAWHELKEPDAEHSLPEGWKVIKTNQNTETGNNVDVHGLLNQYKFFEGDFHDTPEQVHAAHNKTENYKLLDKALKEEGELMGHCVGGYTDDVVSGNSRIFTLRDAKGKPHVTIETNPAKGIEETDEPYTDYHDVAQIKGKGNKEVATKYRAEVLDFLNNAYPHSALVDVEDLDNIGAIDTSGIESMAGGKEINAAIKAVVPDLPRFISRDTWDKLVDQHYVRRPLKGHKDGGIIRLATGGRIKSLDHDRMKFELMMRGKHG